jgi:flagellar protein FlaG
MINDAVKNGYPPTVLPYATNSFAATAKAGSVTPNTAAPKPQLDTKQLKEAVTKLNDYMQNIRRNLSFSIEESTGHTVIKVYDAETDELIRQIPSEETLHLAEVIQDQSPNLFIKEQT